MSAIEVCSKINVSPTFLAEAFWGMDCSQQTEFFQALSGQGERLDREMQLCYLAKEMKLPENEKAKEELMNLAAFLYLHLLREY